MLLTRRLFGLSAIGGMRATDEAGGGEVEAQTPTGAEDEPRDEQEEGLEPAAASQEGSERDVQDQAAPAATLRLLRGGVETGDAFAFSGSAVIGRFDPSVGPIDVDLGGLDEGSYVSRKHARISHEDGGWIIEDLGSSNGTFVLDGDDFRRIEEPARIEDGATVVFGNARFLFRTEAVEEAHAPETASDEP